MKVIRISDSVHAQLKKEAKREGRTLGWWVEYKLTGVMLNPQPVDVSTLAPVGKVGSASFDDLKDQFGTAAEPTIDYSDQQYKKSPHFWGSS
jgi:hypothetical protein